MSISYPLRSPIFSTIELWNMEYWHILKCLLSIFFEWIYDIDFLSPPLQSSIGEKTDIYILVHIYLSIFFYLSIFVNLSIKLPISLSILSLYIYSFYKSNRMSICLCYRYGSYLQRAMYRSKEGLKNYVSQKKFRWKRTSSPLPPPAKIL